MKVVTASRMALIEEEAFKAGADDDQFMQNAASGISKVICNYFRSISQKKVVTLFAGKGNNGGDAYCTALILMEHGFHVIAYQLFPLKDCTLLCQKYCKEFQNKGGTYYQINSASEIHALDQGVLLDGIFGTGFKGEPSPFIIEVINTINKTKCPVFSIDIPSGLEGDTGVVKKSAIKASFTLFLGLPKKGFFIQDGWNYVSNLIHVDFGLNPKYFEEVKPDFEMITTNEVVNLVPIIRRSRHKYEAGFVVGFTGTKGMMGASLLSGMGALKSGSGIVKIVHLEDDFLNDGAYPELIHKTFHYEQLTQIEEYIQKASAIYIGPGLGVSEKMQDFIAIFLSKISKPCVIDADALTVIALKNLNPPKGAILTPHVGEAKRLLKMDSDDRILLMDLCQKYVNEKEVILILKGAPTFIFSKNQAPIVNITGDPGMATAGSGDVLTGIIAGLLSQRDMEPIACAKLSVFLHGKAGEFAAEKKTSFALIATDILKSLHKSWFFLTERKKHIESTPQQ